MASQGFAFTADGQGIQRNPRVIFTGPDYLRDHKVHIEPEHRAVGVGIISTEGTSEVAYLWRAAEGTPHPVPREQRVGGIGWGLDQFTDWSMPLTGRQIMMGQFRQEVEDKSSHMYQNPWYANPNDTSNQSSKDTKSNKNQDQKTGEDNGVPTSSKSPDNQAEQ